MSLTHPLNQISAQAKNIAATLLSTNPVTEHPKLPTPFVGTPSSEHDIFLENGKLAGFTPDALFDDDGYHYDWSVLAEYGEFENFLTLLNALDNQARNGAHEAQYNAAMPFTLGSRMSHDDIEERYRNITGEFIPQSAYQINNNLMVITVNDMDHIFLLDTLTPEDDPVYTCIGIQ